MDTILANRRVVLTSLKLCFIYSRFRTSYETLRDYYYYYYYYGRPLQIYNYYY